MNNFTYCVPTKFHFGRGAENDAGELIRAFGAKKVLIHYGGGSAVRSGLIGRVEKSLEAAGIGYVKLGGVKPNPRDTLVYEGIELARKECVDFILAVGGGSSIDSSKAIAHGVCYDGDFWDFFCGKAKPVKSLPFGAVLTMSAAGSESSNSCVINSGSCLAWLPDSLSIWKETICPSATIAAEQTLVLVSIASITMVHNSACKGTALF